MQKALLFIVLTFVSIFKSFAIDPVVVRSGDINVFIEQGTALIKFAYKSAEVNDMPIDEYIEKKGGYKYEEKWDNWIKNSEKVFVTDFNKHSTGLKLTRNKKSPVKYTITITFKVLHTGNTLKGFLPAMSLKNKRGSAMMNGIVDVKDTKGKSVCVADLKNIYGTDGFNVSSRLATLYLEIDKRIRKAAKKMTDTDEDIDDEETDKDDEVIEETTKKEYDEEDADEKYTKNNDEDDEVDDEDDESDDEDNEDDEEDEEEEDD